MTTLSHDDREALAASLALGLLEGSDLEAALRLVDEDTEFAGSIDDWRSRLTEIDATAPCVMAGEDLWSRIDVSIEAIPAVASAGEPEPMPAIVRQHSSSLGQRLATLWNRVTFWRPVGIAAVAASIAFAVGLGFAMREAMRQPVLVAVLLTDTNQPGAIVNVAADGTAELVPLDDIPVPPGRVLQIWTLWDRVRGPVSIGLASSAHRLDLDIKALPRAGPEQLFEITLEPEGGSPTGRPTGPILMKGTTARAL